MTSRHRTIDHLRQLPAREALTRSEPEVAVPILLAECGTDARRWAALLPALSFGHDDTSTFGQLLDSLAARPADPPGIASGRATACRDGV